MIASNSGYKQRMPAIRLIGEDMKPQAFDVYCPRFWRRLPGWKIFSPAAVSPFQCAVPTGKCLAFHQLYMLALTAFPHLYTNYFERPALHTLHNRSSELWSPLVALAAFFEKQGQVTGLLQTIASAAETDE